MVDSMRYVGRKTMRKLQSRANNEHFTAAPDKDSFGRAMMEKMGWAEGKGVGKNEDGMKTHIRAQKRGAEGLGADKGNAKFEGDNAKSCVETGWYLDVFHKNKNKKKKKKKKKSKKKGTKRKRSGSEDASSSEDDDDEKDDGAPSTDITGPRVIPTDAELFAATGGAMLGRRACPRYGEAGKHKRIADADAAFMAMFMNKNKNKDGASTPATAASTTTTATAAKDGAGNNNNDNKSSVKMVYGSEKFAAAAVQQSLSAKARKDKEAAELQVRSARKKQKREEKRAKKRKKREEAGSFRWKQAIRAELARAGAAGMKEKKLRKAVVAAAMAASGSGGADDEAAFVARFDSKLAKTDGCRRDGKRVFLADQ